MTKSTKSVRKCSWLVALVGSCALLVMAMPAEVSANKVSESENVLGEDGAGVDIKIRALNRSTSDTPFCGVGGGMVGDRLAVDVFMDQDGIVTGTALFEDAGGVVTEMWRAASRGSRDSSPSIGLSSTECTSKKGHLQLTGSGDASLTS